MEVYTILFNRLLSESAKQQASDLHLSVGSIPIIRKDGRLIQLEGEKIIEQEVLVNITNSFLDEREKKVLEEKRELTTVKILGGKFRFKINIYYQRKLLAVSLRLISEASRDLPSLNLPAIVANFTKLASGLIIISGPYGGGKTTTIGALIENINNQQKKRVLTLGKSIEVLFVSKQSIIEQREIGVDVASFVQGLQYAQHEDIDVLAVSNLGDELNEAVPLLLEIASSNCLVFMELNADNVIRVIEKILGCFPTNKIEASRSLLADVLNGIIAQKLLPKVGGGMAPAVEIVTVTSAVRSVIREGKIQQLQTVMQTSADAGMVSMDKALATLVQGGQVTQEDAVANYHDKSGV